MLDFILDAIYAVMKNGISWTALAGVLILFLKNRKLKRYINHHLPPILQNKGDMDLMDIKRNQEIIMNHLGVKPCADSLKATVPYSAKKNATPSILHLPGFITVWSAKKFMKLNTKGLKKMKSKWKSRKFWMSIIAALLVVANEGLDLGISSETVMTFAALVASFIFSEAYVDGKKKKDDGTFGDTGPAE